MDLKKPKDSGPSHYQPYVAPSTVMPELTWPAVLMGSLLGIVFGASSLYLVLKVGLTVSASIPVAVLAIPKLGLTEVVFEGTEASVLKDGPGHMRSTPLPGQAGVSVIMGRSTMYGGPFGRIGTLAPDDTLIVTDASGNSQTMTGAQFLQQAELKLTA